MSELRDLASALGAISKSLTSIEAHVADQNANCEQLRIGLHDLRNTLQRHEGEREGSAKAISQIQVWMGSFGDKMQELVDAIHGVRDQFSSHRREINSRIRGLEAEEETTQP